MDQPRSPAQPEGPAYRPADVADYVAHLCADLVTMARGADLGDLAYMLDVARAEAEARAGNQKSEGKPPPRRK